MKIKLQTRCTALDHGTARLRSDGNRKFHVIKKCESEQLLKTRNHPLRVFMEREFWLSCIVTEYLWSTFSVHS